MKVRELIALLQTFDPELEVLTDGYEGGYTEVTVEDVRTFVRNVNHAWFYGAHETEYDGLYKGNERFQAVYLARGLNKNAREK